MNFKYMVQPRIKKTLNELEALERVLIKFHIPERFYSFGSYVEEAVCIEKKDARWAVYEGERGKKYNIKLYKNIRRACYDLISRVTESNEQEKLLKQEFDREQRRGLVSRPSQVKVFRTKSYNELEAIALIKKCAMKKFDETITVQIKTGCDSRQAEQRISGAVVLPNISTNVKVLVFAKGDKAKEAKKAGADYVGGTELLAKIQNDGWLDFDVVVATPDMMGIVEPLSKILEPKGLMPNSKAGTVTMDVTKAIKNIREGKIEYRLNKANVIHVPIGKASFSEEQLNENLDAIMKAVIKARPKTVRGQFLRSVTIGSSRGSNVKVSLNAIKRENERKYS